MKMAERSKKMLIESIEEILSELPEYDGEVHFYISISIEGNIFLNFDDPVKRELIGLFKKRYISQPATGMQINKKT